MPPDVQAIIDAANQNRQALQAIESEVVAKIAAITAAAVPGQGLNAAALAAIQDLRKSQRAALEGINELGLVTAAALDDAGALHHLAVSLAAAAQGLTDRTNAITQVSHACASITAVCAGISTIVTQLTALIGQN